MSERAAFVKKREARKAHLLHGRRKGEDRGRKKEGGEGRKPQTDRVGMHAYVTSKEDSDLEGKDTTFSLHLAD